MGLTMLNPYARPTVHTTLIAIRFALQLVATTPSAPEREDWEKREIGVGCVGQVRTIDETANPPTKREVQRFVSKQ